MENILQIARDIVDKKNNRLLNDVVARYYSAVDGDEIRYWIYQNPINQRVHMPSGHAMVYKNSISIYILCFLSKCNSNKKLFISAIRNIYVVLLFSKTI